MPPRLGGSSKTSYFPSPDSATYRDLLLFEERLKTNTASLRRRKSRYQAFLFQLFICILILASDVWLETSFLTLPLNILLHQFWDDQFPYVTANRYITSGMLMVATTTLVLFFASGTYAEKIGYANKYVPHANRALRNFNMYFNVRPQPIQSYLNPLSFLFPRPPPPPAPSLPPPTSPISPTRRAAPLAPIPPASNPRGELIFSSRVDRGFRESYERYRAAFEKKREEREKLESQWWYLRYIPFLKMKEVPIPIRLPRDTLTPSPSSSRRSSPAPRRTLGPRRPRSRLSSQESQGTSQDSESDREKERFITVPVSGSDGSQV